MKTKIIYISGNEVFDIADIRAAFDEVRGALGLANDTVLFGVPVDSDDAFASSQPQTESDVSDQGTLTTIAVPIAELAPETTEIIDDDALEIDDTVSEIVDDVVPIAEPAPVMETVVEDVVESEITPDDTFAAGDEVASETPVVPITSILTAVMPIVEPEKESETETVAETEPESDAEPEQITDDTDDIIEYEIVVDEDTSDATHDDTPVSVDDMIIDDTPPAPVEKTLEQLLESMTPLREDHDEDITPSDEDEDNVSATDENIADDGPVDNTPDIDATDATLEQLAAEFVQSQDKIATAPTSGRGKIGKLKNILPFKKARRDDGGLMGDLFGWAGIAANDEDFSMPGFFANASSKK